MGDLVVWENVPQALFGFLPAPESAKDARIIWWVGSREVAY